MFESIRRRLTLGYIGIFALLLVILGAIVTASFARQAATQQDELLEQRAQGDADFVAGPLLGHYQTGREGRRNVEASAAISPSVPFDGPRTRTSVW